MTTRPLVLAMGLLAMCSSDIAHAADNTLKLTIYGDGRTLVDDTRDISFENGTQSISLPGVSSAILPQSVTIRADDIEILEQNFDFDLLTPAKLMEKAVGQRVQLVRINPVTGEEEKRFAKVLSVNNGTVIQVDGQIEVLRADQVPTRVIFPKVPENLRAEPTLSLKLDTDRPGTRPLGLSYLTSGVIWEADYVLTFDEEAGEMDIQGWATLENKTETGFEDAELSVIAGYVGTLNNQGYYNRSQGAYYDFYWQRRGYLQNIFNQQRRAQRQGGTEASSQERVGDNLIYRLPNKTTLAAKQKKQIAIVEAEGVTAKKAFEFYNTGYASAKTPLNAESRIAFFNSQAAGLGEALPSGTVRVYSKDSRGQSQFIGEEKIGHIAGGSDISLKIGEAFDITVKPKLVSSKDESTDVAEYSMKFELRNSSADDVDVRLYQNTRGYNYPFGFFINSEFLSESQPGTEENAGVRYWDLEIPAEGTSELTFTVRETRRR